MNNNCPEIQRHDFNEIHSNSYECWKSSNVISVLLREASTFWKQNSDRAAANERTLIKDTNFVAKR